MHSQKKMAEFMAAERERTIKEPGELDEDYKQRLYTLARPAFEQYMAQEHAKLMVELHGENADTRDRLARERGESGADTSKAFDFRRVVNDLHKSVVMNEGESHEDFNARIRAMARRLEVAHYGEVVESRESRDKARREAREAKQADIDARVEARERAFERPVQTMSVRQERLHSKQTRLNRCKERFTR